MDTDVRSLIMNMERGDELAIKCHSGRFRIVLVKDTGKAFGGLTGPCGMSPIDTDAFARAVGQLAAALAMVNV